MFLPGLVVFYILYIVWKLINEWWYNYFKHERLILWGIIMIKGRKVYDIVTNTWSTGYWIPIYDRFGHIVEYVPVWRD